MPAFYLTCAGKAERINTIYGNVLAKNNNLDLKQALSNIYPICG